MSPERWSAVAVAGAAIALAGLERVLPYNRGQKLFRTGFWSDFVLYTFAQSYVLGLVIGRLIQLLDRQTGWSHHGLISAWPIWFQISFFVLTHDLYIYVFHRVQHRFHLLWRIHEAHHSAEAVDWLAAARSHSLEILINQTIEFAPIVLLGAAPSVAVIKGAISAVWGMFIHANVDVRLGPLQYVFNGPEMHRWHHADVEEAYGKNFGTKFALWDWILGTAYFPRPKKAERYGLGYDGFPEGYFLQQARVFKRRLRDEGSTEGTREPSRPSNAAVRS